MGSRSRKRKRSAGGAAEPATTAPARTPAPAPAPPDAPQSPEENMRRGYARGRARDDEIRASLVPLQPGERPPVVTLAAVIAFIFAIANAAAALTGNDISTASGDPSVATAITTALLLVAAFGMLARQYWAVLGFETILGVADRLLLAVPRRRAEPRRRDLPRRRDRAARLAVLEARPADGAAADAAAPAAPTALSVIDRTARASR